MTKLQQLTTDTQINDGLLFKLVQTNWLPYIRPSSRVNAVIEGHTQVGHGAVRNSYKWLKARYYWEGMMETVQQVIDSCLTCRAMPGLILVSSMTYHPLVHRSMWLV